MDYRGIPKGYVDVETLAQQSSLDLASLSQLDHWVLAGSQSLVDPAVMMPTLSSDVGLPHIL